jgi:hypothetical protein
MATIPPSSINSAFTPSNTPVITHIQVEGNDMVSFLNGTNYVRSMSQIVPQAPAYLSYRYDTVTISQVGGDSFTFRIYDIAQVGGVAFTVLTYQDTQDVVQAKTIEVYRLLVTSIFKGCCECGNTEPECSIQYTYGEDPSVVGTFKYTGSLITFNYTTGNNQDFTSFFPIVQDGSWVFIFSKTDPTIYAVIQLSNFVDQTTYAQFDAIELNAQGVPFVVGTEFCIDFTSVGGSLVQGWQDTLDINSVLDKDNTVDGAGFNFVFDNNESFTINSGGGSVETDATGASLNAGDQQILVTSGYIDIITPNYLTAGTGWVLALTGAGHVEYTEAGTGTISSIGLNMPPAFTVSTPNPLTENGEFTVDGAGDATQYINGLGELATLPVYTVENGLHTKESPADPLVFHLGGQLIENTLIETTNGTTQYQLSVRGSANQDTQFPFGVANLGSGGVATFQDYGSGNRPNPSVEIVGDVDLAQPLLELRMQGNLPNGTYPNSTGYLSLKYDGATANNVRSSIDFEYPDSGNNMFLAGRLTTELVSNTNGNERSKFDIQLIEGGSFETKLELNGTGQLTLNEYGSNTFLNGAPTYSLVVDSTGLVWKKQVNSGGTVTSVGGEGLITTTATNPFTVAGTVTTSVNENRLVGRWAGAGTGIMQEITIGDGLSLSATGELTADGSIPAYDGDQGIYKDTTLTNDTFQLGAPSGSQGGIAFSIDRFISVQDKSLQMEGTSSVLRLVEGSASLPARPATLTATAQTNYYAGYFTSNTGEAVRIVTSANSTALIVESQLATNTSFTAAFQNDYGPGIDVKSKTASRFWLYNGSPNSIQNVVEFQNVPSAGPYVAGQGVSISFTPGGTALLPYENAIILNSVISDVTSGSERADFRIDTFNNGASLNHSTFIGSGQLQLNQYTTSTSFAAASGASIGVLNVDNTGKVFVGDGGGGTYTVNNGLTENPTDNFQLGGPLVDNTIVTGGSTPFSFSMKFEDLSNFNVNAYDSANFYSITLKSEQNPAVQNARIDINQNESALNYDDVVNGRNAYMGASGESSLNMLTANFGIFSSFGDVGFIAAINATNTDHYLSIKTPNVSNASAQVGQVLTLVQSTGIVEFQNGGTPSPLTTKGDIWTYATTISGSANARLPVGTNGQILYADSTTTTGLKWDNAPTGGIPFGTATAAVTDVYTATIGTATSYTDGDAYLVRFTVGNTDAATLNINGIGARTLYRNNDGPLIGGDIFDGGEMLCVYNAVNNGFDCIGSSPNTLFAYVTNDQGSTITKGQAVYAFGGTGNRMTVKLAQANGDATSAQTIGFVFSSSIAANQKGIIIIQGYFTDLSLFPTSGQPAGQNWVDGDPVYLSPTVPGGVTRVKPYAPNHLVYLGVCATATNGASGRMYVRVQNGYELSEIHDVDLISTPPVNNDVLVFDTSTTPDLWKAKSIPTILGYTPVGGTGTANEIAYFTAGTTLGSLTTATYPSLTELSYVKGVTSGIQTQINGKQDTIGLTTVGTNLATLPNPSGVRYLRINAANTVSALTLTELRSDLGLFTTFASVLTSDVATSGTTWQDITGLTFGVTAGKTYKWRATIPYSISSGTFNFAISGPTLTVTRYRFTSAATGTTNFVNNQTGYDTGTLVTGVNGCATSDGIIRCSANGTVSMRMRSSITGALTALIGSIVEFEEIV